jgi:hypothetical protein
LGIVIPGRREAPDPESSGLHQYLDSGFAAFRRAPE